MTKQPNNFVDDPTIPQETTIYYSKTSNYTEVVIMSLLLTGGLYALFKTDDFVAGLVIILVSMFYGYRGIRNAKNKTAQIIINDKGLQTAAAKFYNWSQISGEKVIKGDDVDYIDYYLVYNYQGRSEKLRINDLTTNPSELERLMSIYRGRHDKKLTSR